ncbi:bifunctional aminoglycoside phosphotransferase/ATP-binding protein [Desulfopila sp. IMCC35006]|uniref:bifunctional aminoglycoside phosphotransferase/ATP-binding protein n=1 Tax=Desulfopila sp. IMCC35006 TaxID=2569542 RepID=UPI00197A89D7|nr:bifunctional aminoglycoside phosphotransferase/ATP-binding protein [Desulfopila sp. IMCC35006]
MMSETTLQPASLISSLMQPDVYDPPVEKCTLIETHISWVILAGPYAYKIKKSLNLGFLDFSTLEKRLFYCQEELRLNKRLAPAIYLSVVPIIGTITQPRWAVGGVEESAAIEYAIKMVAFPQQAQLDRLLAHGALQPCHIDILAGYIAAFHQHADSAGADSIYGNPEIIYQPIDENFKQIREHVKKTEALSSLAELESWGMATFSALYGILKQRKSAGFIRECHGDMHLRNIAWVDDAPLVFDCIEFSPSLRWIDVMSDIAFLVMDLQDRKQPALAQRFLNMYLQHTGDYAGVRVLRFYQVYRAMVRAKIDAIRAHQAGIDKKEQTEAENDFFTYLNLALSYVQPAEPLLIITRGVSASGKSTLSQSLLEQLGAIRIRSDVERKRLFGLTPEEEGRAAIGKGIYCPEATRKTYRKLTELAAHILDAGYSVIVDAAFLRYEERLPFRKLADSKKVPFIIIECRADVATLRRRIVQRKNDVSDADLHVLEMQLSTWQSLRAEEQRCAVRVDTGAEVDIKSLVTQMREKFFLLTGEIS